jgi:hypothetical protein
MNLAFKDGDRQAAATYSKELEKVSLPSSLGISLPESRARRA